MMEGYFSRLIERSSGCAATVEPLILPRFAPGPALAHHSGGENIERAGTPGVESGARAHETVDSPAASAMATLAPRAREASPLAAERRATARSEANRALDSVVRDQSSAALRPAASVVPRAESQAQATASSGDLVNEDSAHEASRARQETSDRTRERRAESRLVGPARIIERARRAPFRVADADPLLPGAPGAREPDRPLPLVYSAAGDNAPVIRVTIGRIEVRALAPPAGAAERTARAPFTRALGLEEYLRRRNAGGR